MKCYNKFHEVQQKSVAQIVVILERGALMFRKKFIQIAGLVCVTCALFSTPVFAQQTIADVDIITNKASNAHDKDFFHEYKYPTVNIPNNRKATEKINRYFELRFERSAANYVADEMFLRVSNVSDEYTLTYNDGKYLIFEEKGYQYNKNAAHPNSWQRSVAFLTETGARVKWQDMIASEDKDKVSLEAINAKLANHPQSKGFFDQPTIIKKAPKEYRVDSNGNLHLLFQQYEIAPYAAGIIDLDMGVKIK